MAQKGRNPMAGRHAVGGQLARPGTIRGGQAEPVGNSSHTASRPSVSMKRPYVPDAKDTSLDAERMIAEAPTPFKNKMTAAQMPVGRMPSGVAHPYGLPAKTLSPKTAGARIEQHVGCANTETSDDMLAAVGEARKPRGYTALNSGFRTGGGKRG